MGFSLERPGLPGLNTLIERVRHAQHQQPCLASRTPRVAVREEQPVYQGHTALRSRTVRCQ